MQKQRGGLSGAALGAVVIGATIGGIMLLAMTAGCCSAGIEQCRIVGPRETIGSCFSCCGETCGGILSSSFACIARQFLNATGRDPDQAVGLAIIPRHTNRVVPMQIVNPFEQFELTAALVPQAAQAAQERLHSLMLPAPPSTPTQSQSGVPVQQIATREKSRQIDNRFISEKLVLIIQEVLKMIAHSEEAVKFTVSMNKQEFRNKLQTLVESYLGTNNADLLNLDINSLPKIIVNPNGTIQIANIDNPRLRCFISAIYNLFIKEWGVEVTAEGGSQKQKILLLGRYRKPFKEGHRQFVNIKGHKVPLADAKKLDKKQKLNKKK
jgi:hypothetical protein